MLKLIKGTLNGVPFVLATIYSNSGDRTTFLAKTELTPHQES
jgi:hypothetical protein